MWRPTLTLSGTLAAMSDNPDTPEPGDGSDEATPEETRRTGFDEWSPRGYSIYRHVLVQRPVGGPRPGLLGTMVTGRQHRALLLYLLIVGWWPWLQKYETPLSADVWLRALEATGKHAGTGLTWSASSLSRTFADLEALKLIEMRVRTKRYVLVVPRREDGAAKYTAPTGAAGDPYFTLPHAFWTSQLFARLSLPGLAVLLIILKETNNRDDVWLSRENMTDWYGISDRSVTRGLAELRDKKILGERPVKVTAPMSPGGVTTRTHYWLVGDYSRASRDAARTAAKAVRDKAATPATASPADD